jgi:hypothetical protein
MKERIADIAKSLLGFFRGEYFRKRILFIGIFSASLLINIVFLYIFEYDIAYTKFSRFPKTLMILVIINGVLSYFLRHVGNYLTFGGYRVAFWNLISREMERPEYESEFFWQFTLYWFAIPFYLPCIFFVSSNVHSLWALLVLLFPQIVYIAYEIRNMVRLQKQEKPLDDKVRRELNDPQTREENGYSSKYFE